MFILRKSQPLKRLCPPTRKKKKVVPENEKIEEKNGTKRRRAENDGEFMNLIILPHCYCFLK